MHYQKMRNFKFIDLFCGIGGFHQAMQSLGGECVFASDIDKYCQNTYEKNYGLRPIGDITKVKEEDIPKFDVLCGGFPCQAFSVAGKRLGFDDPTKGTLFFDIIRIMKYHKPKYALLENVKNLASHDDGNTWRVIYETLTEIGYTVLKEPIVFSPHYIGIPQLRERVFIMCVRRDIEDKLPQFYFNPNNIKPCSMNTILQDDSEVDNKYNLSADYIQLLEHWNRFILNVNKDEPEVPGFSIWDEYLCDCDVEHELSLCLPYREPIIRKCKELYLNNKDFIDKWHQDGKSVSEFNSIRTRLEWQCNKDRKNANIWNYFIQFRQSGIRVKEATFFPTLVAMNQTSIIGPKKRYITPRECARLQSFPDTFIMDDNESQAYKQFGNSVNVECIKLFAKYMFGDEETRKEYSFAVQYPNELPDIISYELF